MVAALKASAQTDSTLVFHYGFLSYETALRAMPEYANVQQSLTQLKEQYEAETLRVEDEFNR